ncbi:hypothetical protein BKA80DRAFT_132895 [Phyllosticta citrichinensis]
MRARGAQPILVGLTAKPHPAPHSQSERSSPALFRAQRKEESSSGKKRGEEKEFSSGKPQFLIQLTCACSESASLRFPDEAAIPSPKTTSQQRLQNKQQDELPFPRRPSAIGEEQTLITREEREKKRREDVAIPRASLKRRRSNKCATQHTSQSAVPYKTVPKKPVPSNAMGADEVAMKKELRQRQGRRKG